MFKSYANYLKNIRENLTPVSDFVHSIADPYGSVVYSQEGEDILLRRYMGENCKGLYVDIGAFHPKRFSNTYFYYKRGWSGLNIEPNPAVHKQFLAHRSRDININKGVSLINEKKNYYVFNESALNTFDESIADRLVSEGIYKLINVLTIEVDRLENILSSNLPVEVEIDFMTVDCEGYDLNVLMSNDWKKFRPNYILAESFNDMCSIFELNSNEIVQYLISVNYLFVAKTYNTLLFKKAIC